MNTGPETSDAVSEPVRSQSAREARVLASRGVGMGGNVEQPWEPGRLRWRAQLAAPQVSRHLLRFVPPCRGRWVAAVRPGKRRQRSVSARTGDAAALVSTSRPEAPRRLPHPAGAQRPHTMATAASPQSGRHTLLTLKER
ncbi:unnamed protein product [Lampetra planeri]